MLHCVYCYEMCYNYFKQSVTDYSENLLRFDAISVTANYDISLQLHALIFSTMHVIYGYVYSVARWHGDPGCFHALCTPPCSDPLLHG